jgi:hypothetical protein
MVTIATPVLTFYFYMFFRRRRWIDRLSVMMRGAEIKVLGQIREVSSHQIKLDNCELEE